MSDDLMNFLEDINSSKECRTCGELKDLNCFSRDKDRALGRSNQCKTCYSEYHERNKYSINARRESNRKKKTVDEHRTYHKWYNSTFKDKIKNKHLVRKYGISLEKFMSMIESQSGKCKICKNVLSIGRFTHVDHCHRTGKVRGILCHKCNTKLGWYEKNSTAVDDYLREYEPMVSEYFPSYALLN